jgi:YVTN family beta-propeller protein
MKLSGFVRVAVVLSLALFGACFLLGTYAKSKPAAIGGYHVIKTIPLPDAPGGKVYYDYITFDAQARRVYFGHGSEVVVLNADDYSVVGKISGLNRSHGVALAKEYNKGFITDGDATLGPELQKVHVFDLKTLKVTGEIPTKQVDTDAILYEPVTKHIFSINGDSGTLTVIDPVKETVITNIDTAGGSLQNGTVDGKGTVFVNSMEKNLVIEIDAKTNTVKNRYPVSPVGQPVPMAMDQKTRRLFLAGRNPQMMAMMDADTGKIIQSYPISNYVDFLTFDPGTGLVFVSTREGFVHVFHEDSPDKLSEVEKVKTEYGAKTCQIDPKTHNLFTATEDYEPAPAPTEKVPHPWATKTKPGNYRIIVLGR